MTSGGERSDRELRLREKVQRWLTEEFGPLMVTAEGGISVPAGSSRVWVEVHPYGDDELVVQLTAPVLFDVPPSREFSDWVLENSATWVLGGLVYFEDEEGATLLFRHTILGDYLDKAELLASAYAVGSTADLIDDDLQARFGGERVADV